MSLVYLYIENIGRSIEKQGINFGSNFNVKYDSDSFDLIIRKSNTKQISYGNNILSLDLIVGKNGSGKSSILDLLALPKYYRKQPWGPFNEFCSWFSIYHIKNNVFSIEGCGSAFLNLMHNASCKLNFLDNYLNSAIFKYDFDAAKIISSTPPDYLRDYEYEHKEQDSLSTLYYAYYKVMDNIKWTKNLNIDTDTSHGGVTYRRVFLTNPKLSNIVKYLSNLQDDSDILEKEFVNSPSVFLEIGLLRPKELLLDFDIIKQEPNVIEKVSKLIYNNDGISIIPMSDIDLNDIKDAINPMPNYSKFKIKFIIRYLEDCVFKILSNNVNDKKINSKLIYKEKPDNYEARQSFLYELIKDIGDSDFVDIVSETINVLKKIPEIYFTRKGLLKFNLKEEKSKWVHEFAIIIELTNLVCDKKEDTIGRFEYAFSGISSGEAYLIDIYASLYNLIGKFEGHEKSEYTCILVLDEPDARFHPEWSRKFISNITRRLQTGMFKDYKFQIIISTHSPYFVTDVEPEYIHCLKAMENGGMITVVNAKNGFLSQLGDVLMDDFFVDSVFGAFSEDYVNDIISEMDELDKKQNNINQEILKNIELKIKPIKDSLIYNCLFSRLSSIRRKMLNIK